MRYVVTNDHTATTWGPFSLMEADEFVRKMGGRGYWIVRAGEEHLPNPRIYEKYAVRCKN